VVCGHGDRPGRRSSTTRTSTWSRSRVRLSREADRRQRGHDAEARALELGGKAPVVVFDDVELESALETIAGTGYYNAGQDCTAATRVLAGPKVYDEVVAGLSKHAQSSSSVTLGRGHDLGPSTRRASASVWRSARAPRQARRARHGRQRAGRFRLLPRTHSARRLKQDDELIQREIFGPVITVQRFSDEEEAIKWATERPTVSLPRSGRATSSGRFASKALRFGCVWINDHIPLAPRCRTVASSRSGYGKDLSIYSLEDYTVLKHVMAKLD